MTHSTKRLAQVRDLGDGDCGVWVAYDDREQAKTLPGSRWDKGLKCWRVPVRFERDARALVDALNGTIDTELESALGTIFRRLSPQLGKDTYKALARAWHPDSGGGDLLAAQVLTRVWGMFK